ncbi:hypothetical protein FDUTEX481_07198 [Tolypothrix sp. PCC 7601]|nr:hypothetical protein FDUTEX481_07198 [Tolypothrix sp. PCC 7601]BAY95611.1 hypothetical protein NIES3275_76880 [Microchaete diplosiphon NIES-3275]
MIQKYLQLKNITVSIDPGMDYYEQRYRERMVKNLHKKAQAFGFELIPQVSENLVS